jgi:tartrate dehydrogenase/decarboxylase/D-malate dehydrogenase
MPRHRIAVIPGDGIGPEVTAIAVAVLDAVAPSYDLALEYEDFDWSCQRYAETGAMMPADAIDVLRGFDEILLGAVGWRGVPDHVSLWGLLSRLPWEHRSPVQGQSLRRSRPGSSSWPAGTRQA